MDGGGTHGSCDHTIKGDKHWEIEVADNMLLRFGDSQYPEWTGVGLITHEMAHNITWADSASTPSHLFQQS